MTLATLEYDKRTWEIPPPFPRTWHGKTTVGIPLPSTRRIQVPQVYEQFKRMWRGRDAQIWPDNMLVLNRKSWEKRILRKFWDFYPEMRVDATPWFRKHMQQLIKLGGAIIVISGKKGSAKSFNLQLLLVRFADEIACNAYMVWEHKDVPEITKNVHDMEMVIGVDEDLEATGEGSGNLLVHLSNTRQTIRKTKLVIISAGVKARGGEDVDLWLEPCGSNWKYQTCRFAVYDEEKHFMGFVALQRKHGPEYPVYYYENLGVLSEYDSRAIEYSRVVLESGGVRDAIDDRAQDRHVGIMKDFLRDNFITRGREIPDVKRCKRWYRKAKLPAKGIGYMEEVILHAKDELEEELAEEEDQARTTARKLAPDPKDWLWLREHLRQMVSDDSLASEFALYHVPDSPRISYADLARQTSSSILPDSLGKRVRDRRLRLTPTELGRLGEQFVASQLEHSRAVAGGSEGAPDVLLTMPDGVEVALNVKLTLADELRKHDETTPEDRYMPNAVCVLLLPRLLECRLYPITGQKTYLNSREGRLVAISGLAEGIREVLGK